MAAELRPPKPDAGSDEPRIIRWHTREIAEYLKLLTKAVNDLSGFRPVQLYGATVGATTGRLTTDGAAANGFNVPTLPDVTGYRARGWRLIASAEWTGGTSGAQGDCASWDLSALLARPGSIATLTLVGGGGTSLSPTFSRGAGANWRLSVTADTALDALNVSGVGAANNNVAWRCLLLSPDPVFSVASGAGGTNPGAVSGGSSPGGGDPFWSSVILYLAPQPNGSATVVDASPANATVTRTGSGTWSTVQSIAPGGTSFNNPGTATEGTNFLEVAASTTQNLPGDFTIDGWFYMTSASDNFVVWFNKLTAGSANLAIERGTSTGNFNAISTTAGSLVGAFSPLPLNAWHHVAIERSGSTVRWYVNGSPAAPTRTLSATLDGAFVVGKGATGDNGDFTGYIGPVRITKGVARYNNLPFVPSVDSFGWMQTGAVSATLNQAHRYWMLQFTGNNGNTNSSVGDIYWRSTAGGAQQATGGTAIGGNNFAGEPIANAYDNNAATVATMLGPHGRFGYDFGTAKSIAEVAIRHRGDGFPDTGLSGFVVYSSDDGIRWLPEWSVSGQSGWTAGETRTYTRP